MPIFNNKILTTSAERGDTMSKKWNPFGNFRKKRKENDITLFPDPKDVFIEPGMEMYFTPLLTYNYKLNDKEYKIHILTSAGLICENSYLNSENRFFSFKYLNGKYIFIGNLHTFGNSDIKDVYSFLREDFDKNKNYYLEQKVPLTDYMKIIKPLVRKAGTFTEGQSLSSYAENFYSYEMEKYNYEKTGKMLHLFEITEAVSQTKKQFFYNTDETNEILANFFGTMNEYLKNRYNFKDTKPVCAVDTFCFTNFSSTAVTFFNPEESIVYTFEYSK